MSAPVGKAAAPVNPLSSLGIASDQPPAQSSKDVSSLADAAVSELEPKKTPLAPENVPSTKVEPKEPPTVPISPRPVSPETGQHTSAEQQEKDDSAEHDSKPQTYVTQVENPVAKTHFSFEGQLQPAPAAKDLRSSPPTSDVARATNVVPATESNPVSRPQPMREINLRLEGDDATKVDVRLIERAGKVQIQVRTPDQELTKSLQGGLGDLVGRLENKGYKTEAWIPSLTRHVQPMAADHSHSSSGGDRNPGGSSAREQQDRQQRQSSNGRKRPAWAAQFEESLSSEETRSSQ